MRLVLHAEPATEPVTLAEAKAQCRVIGSAEDDFLDALVVAARQAVEEWCNRALITQTWDLTLDGFPPCGAPIDLPKGVLQGVSSITYRDVDGVARTWDSANYRVDASSRFGGRLFPVSGGEYPRTEDAPSSVTIRFAAGYGTGADAVPRLLKVAVKMLVAHWYVNRESVVTGTIATVLPDAVERILRTYRVASA
jgi:uncharacterized phiE125 gp8 family phage protein